MKKKIRAMYFSGTGITAKVATGAAYRMWQELDKTEHKTGVSGATDDKIDYVKEENINFTPPEAREKKYTFDMDDIVVFATPVIAGRVPNVLLKFLNTLEGGGAMAVPLVVYGNRNFDDALIELRNILEERGFHTVAAAAFIGEHSFSKILAAGRPDIEDMKTVERFAKLAAEKILSAVREADGDNERLEAALKAAGPVKVDGQEPLRGYYQPRDRKGNHINILKVKPKLNKEKCDGCGICVSLCPMGSISEEEPGLVKGICIKCCACVKKCPREALYFDDPGYLYHKEELEAQYMERKEPSLFL